MTSSCYVAQGGALIPINDLRRPPLNTSRQREELDVTAQVASSGWYFNGPFSRSFEADLAAFVGVPHVVGVASGTDALTLALGAMGIGEGRVVATVANAGYYSSLACRRVGARPRYVDVDLTTACMSPEGLDEALATSDVDAVIVTHLYGRMASVERIAELCQERGVPLIEDCAQSLGARRSGRMAGSYGDLAAFSFYPTKNLGAMGDAGAVAASTPELEARVRQLAQYGWSAKYEVVIPAGMNSRLDEMQAAILGVRLGDVEMENRRRSQIVRHYARQLENSPASIFHTPDSDFVGHLAVVLTPHRDRVRRELLAAGIATEIHYPIPDYRQPVQQAEFQDFGLPVTERLAAGILTVPCFPTMSEPEIEKVGSAVARAVQDSALKGT